MALWERAQQLPSEALRQIYGDLFPIEVRHCLAEWIEANIRNWDAIDVENVAHAHHATSVLQQLIHEIDVKLLSYRYQNEMLPITMKLQEASLLFKLNCENDPLTLIATIRDCLTKENQLVQERENSMQADMVVDTNEEIKQELSVLKNRTKETELDLRHLASDQENFAIQINNNNNLEAYIKCIEGQSNINQGILEYYQLRKQEEGDILNQKAQALIDSRRNLQEKLRITINSLTVQQRIRSELNNWKKEQRMVGCERSVNESKLDQIQTWCESLAETLWENFDQIKECKRLLDQLNLEVIMPNVLQVNILPTLSEHITQLLTTLVTSTFVIEKEPPQVMKTNTKFKATVRLLVGRELNVHMARPEVQVSIISEEQAQSLLKQANSMKNCKSGEIINSVGTMEYNQTTRQLSVKFGNMQLKKIKRAEKKNAEFVMDGKFALLFRSKFSIGGGELVFQVWTISLPVVVIVHGNQEPNACATISWDNAFAEDDRIPFQVPEKVPWSQVAELLSMMFKASTGSSLSQENLDFLASKALRNNEAMDYSQMMLSWSQFCKDLLPDKTFTFWEWFYAAKKIAKDHLRQLCKDNSIVGFVSKGKTRELLMERPSGTFLLRFSESELGGISIACVNTDASQGDQRDIIMVQPFTCKDLSTHPLANSIHDLPYLSHLLPDIPKEQAFERYDAPLPAVCSRSLESSPYVPRWIQMVTDFPSTNSTENSTHSYCGISSPPSVNSIAQAVDPLINILLNSTDNSADSHNDISSPASVNSIAQAVDPLFNTFSGPDGGVISFHDYINFLE